MLNRREFIEAALAVTVAANAPTATGCSSNKGTSKPAFGEVPRRALGRSGQSVSALGLGGWHIGIQDSEQESIRIIRAAIDGGITFLDNCWDYNAGQSEIRMGKALRDGYRERAFLMTKFDGRDAKTATEQLDESLRRLQTDHLDLLQLHEVIWEQDPQLMFDPGGPAEAMLAAQKAGKVRLLGFTGHKSPDIHLRMLQEAEAHGFRFDAVQMPLNLLDAHYDSFEKKVLPVLLRQEIGVLGMKPMGSGFFVWDDVAEPEECLRYALSLPTSVVITGCDSMPMLEQALEIGRRFEPMSEQEVDELLARTEQAARSGSNERYKTTHRFDGTYQNKSFLGPRAPDGAPAPGKARRSFIRNRVGPRPSAASDPIRTRGSGRGFGPRARAAAFSKDEAEKIV